MYVLGIILARAGSKGLPNKCVRTLLGRPLIEYTFDHAVAAQRLDHVILTTDSVPAKKLAIARGVAVVDRPAALAVDDARVDAAARHAVEHVETSGVRRVDAIVLLYGNIPVRPVGAIDRCVDLLIETDSDSVRTVARVGKHHPDWLHRLDGDHMQPFRANGIYRRQDLTPLYYHDGAVAVVTRSALFSDITRGDDGQAFLGHDRRAVVLNAEDAVDVDTAMDLMLAEAVLRSRDAKAVLAT